MSQHRKTIAMLAAVIAASAMADEVPKSNSAPMAKPPESIFKIGKFLDDHKPRELHPTLTPIIGNWKGAALLKSSSKKPEFRQFNQEWKGGVTGGIYKDGKIKFRLENGCYFESQITPYASETTWSFQATFQFCPYNHYNQVMTGRLWIDAKGLGIQAVEPASKLNWPVTYVMQLTAHKTVIM